MEPRAHPQLGRVPGVTGVAMTRVTMVATVVTPVMTTVMTMVTAVMTVVAVTVMRGECGQRGEHGKAPDKTDRKAEEPAYRHSKPLPGHGCESDRRPKSRTRVLARRVRFIVGTKCPR